MSNVALSWSRVEAQAADDMHMAVDEAGVGVPVAPPSNEWMEAARMAADTDGILENASAKRQKVCISCNTLTSPAHANHAQECTQKRESLQKARVRVARKCEKKMTEKEHRKGLLRLSSELAHGGHGAHGSRATVSAMLGGAGVEPTTTTEVQQPKYNNRSISRKRKLVDEIRSINGSHCLH